MIRGVSIRNKGFQNIIDNITAREVTKLQNASMLALKNVIDDGITSWYKKTHSRSNGLALKQSIKCNVWKVTQNKQFVEIEVRANIDSDIYEYFTSHYAIHDWDKRHGNVLNTNPSYFVWDLQWNQGILGLPKMGSVTGWENPHFRQYTSIHNYLYESVGNRFSTVLNKYY